MRGAGDELVLAFDRRDLLEHRLALVRVDPEAADHVKEAVGVDVFLVGVAAEDEFQFRRGDEFADDMENVVSDDAFGGGEIPDPHADDPTLGIAQFVALPLLDVLLHRDIFRLPVVRLHRAVKLVGPLILQRKQVEGFCLAAVDNALGGVGFFGLCLIEDEGAVSDSEILFHGACG